MVTLFRQYLGGEYQDLYDEYYDIGMVDATIFERDVCGGTDEDWAKWKTYRVDRQKRQRKLFPDILVALRKILPESIEVMVGEETRESEPSRDLC